MRILITADTLSLGGLETHILCHVRFFKRLGIEVYVRAKRISGLMRTAFATEGIDCDAYADAADLVSLIKAKGIHIVHAHPFNNLKRSAYAARRVGVPMVTTCHSIPTALHPIRAVKPIPDHIFCVCDAIKAALDRAGINPSSSSVAYNGVDVTDAPVVTQSISPRHSGEQWAAYVGRLDPDKLGTLSVIRAACERTDWHLLIIGGRSRDFPNAAHGNSQRATGSRLVFVGPTLDVVGALSRVDFVFGAGRSAIGAMACGKVVFVVNARSYEGVVNPYNAQYLLQTNFSARGGKRIPLSIERLAVDMIHAMRHRQFLGMFAQSFARIHLSVEQSALHHLAIYRKLSAPTQ